MPDPAQAAVTALTGSTTEPVGRFSYDVPTDTWWWSTSLYTVYGFTPGEIVPTAALMLAHQHPDDRSRAVQLIASAVTAGKPFSSRHRILDAQRRIHTVVTIGEGIRDGHGQIIKVSGYLIDVTDALHRDVAGRHPDGGRAVRRNPGHDRTGQGRPDDHLRARRRRGVRVATLALPTQQHQTPGHRRSHHRPHQRPRHRRSQRRREDHRDPRPPHRPTNTASSDTTHSTPNGTGETSSNPGNKSAPDVHRAAIEAC